MINAGKTLSFDSESIGNTVITTIKEDGDQLNIEGNSTVQLKNI